MSYLIAAALIGCAVVGTAVVLVREPLRQAMVAGAYGGVLVVTFLLLRAPDVALSAIVVAGVARPVLTLLALARIDREADGPDQPDPTEEADS